MGLQVSRVSDAASRLAVGLSFNTRRHVPWHVLPSIIRPSYATSQPRRGVGRNTSATGQGKREGFALFREALSGPSLARSLSTPRVARRVSQSAQMEPSSSCVM
jgi:hypothetical protein